MEVLTKAELEKRYEEIVERIREGAIFIHPTDTIYGIGCNAQDEKAVEKVRQLKQRFDNPFSIWVPELNWIKDNCKITKKAKPWLAELPGPFTLIMATKDSPIASNVAPKLKTVGIRHPEHWFSQIVKLSGVPIVTTSANKAGEPFMTDVENIDPDIERGVDFMIYEGEKKGRASKIINIEKDSVKER